MRYKEERADVSKIGMTMTVFKRLRNESKKEALTESEKLRTVQIGNRSSPGNVISNTKDIGDSKWFELT